MGRPILRTRNLCRTKLKLNGCQTPKGRKMAKLTVYTLVESVRCVKCGAAAGSIPEHELCLVVVRRSGKVEIAFYHNWCAPDLDGKQD